MTTYITHIRTSPPHSNDDQHIADVRWSQPADKGLQPLGHG